MLLHSLPRLCCASAVLGEDQVALLVITKYELLTPLQWYRRTLPLIVITGGAFVLYVSSRNSDNANESVLIEICTCVSSL